ncbi:MAG: dUTP diphosphatase [Alicyclobacillus sp.]|nr:dUTP diphosphatase [Alicyclobacillus sp.]
MPDFAPDGQSLTVRYCVVSPYFRPEYLPAYATAGAAGMDLHACLPEPLQLEPGMRVRVPTGIALQLPHRGVVALVYARSGLAWRYGIALPNGVGVIDSDYTGELQVLLTHAGSQPYVIHPGDRIAQVVFAPVYTVQLLAAQALQPTLRGERGFGSTGVSVQPQYPRTP